MQSNNWCLGRLVYMLSWFSTQVGLLLASQPAGSLLSSENKFEQGFPVHWGDIAHIRGVRTRLPARTMSLKILAKPFQNSKTP